MGWFDFFVIALASFRLTRLLVYDKITEFIRKPFHHVIEEELPDGTIVQYLQIKGTGIRKWVGELLSCYWCTGIWCAAFFYFLYEYYFILSEPLLFIFAIAAVASIIESCITKLIN